MGAPSATLIFYTLFFGFVCTFFAFVVNYKNEHNITDFVDMLDGEEQDSAELHEAYMGGIANLYTNGGSTPEKSPRHTSSNSLGKLWRSASNESTLEVNVIEFVSAHTFEN